MQITVDASRLKILANQQEINVLLMADTIDHLAVQQLQNENSRLARVIQTAERIISAAPRTSRVDNILNQFMPRAFQAR